MYFIYFYTFIHFLLQILLYHYKTEIDIVSPGICLVRKKCISCIFFDVIPAFHHYYLQILYLRRKNNRYEVTTNNKCKTFFSFEKMCKSDCK